jgi:methyltransferase (TIGR00027 family)
MKTASQSALTAAAARAAHLHVDRPPWIFADTLAEALLGDQAEPLIAYHRRHGDHLVLAGARAQVLVRSQVTESILRSAQAHGTTQYAILGAGLDTYAYREAAPGCTVFEVDHPSSQQDKRERLAAAEISPTSDVVYAPVNFEARSLRDGLSRAGFDTRRPAVVSWLGVSMYLTRSAVTDTLTELGTLAPGTELVFDYMLPATERNETGNTYVEMVAPNSAANGERRLTFLAPDELTAMLGAVGFTRTSHYSQADAIGAELWNRTDPLKPTRLSMIAHAVL